MMFIKANKHRFGVERMCRVLKVSRRGYYSWAKRKESNRAKQRRKWFEGLWNTSNQVQIPFIFSIE